MSSTETAAFAAVDAKNRRRNKAPALQPKRHRKGYRKEQLTKVMFIVPAAILVALLFGYPIVKNLLMSFQEYTLATFFTGEAPWVGFENYAFIFGEALFTKAFVNTLVFTAASILGQFVIGLALAVFFKNKFPLSGVLRALLLLPWLLPLLVSSATWRSILDQDSGILNQVLSNVGIIQGPIPWLTSPDLALVSLIMVNIWIGIPFNVTLLYGGLQDIPEELYEAGSLDGATGWKSFWYITWPNLRPVVSVVLVLGVVYTLKVLDIILGVTGGGPANSTETLSTQSYEKSFIDFQFGQGAAIANVLILLSLVFAIIYLRVNRRAIDE